jgi:hypothetical protein
MEPWRREAKRLWDEWKRDGTYSKVYAEWSKYRTKPKPVGIDYLELEALMKAIWQEAESWSAEGADPDQLLEAATEAIDPRLTADENCEVIRQATRGMLSPVLRVERPRAVARSSAKVKRELPKVEEKLERWFELKPEEREEVERKVEELERAAETATPLPADLTSELWKLFSQFPEATEEAFREWVEENRERIPKMSRQELFTSIRAFLEEYRARRYARLLCPYCRQPVREVTELLGVPVPPEVRVYLYRCANPSCISYGHIFLLREGKLREVTPKEAALQLRVRLPSPPAEFRLGPLERLFFRSIRFYSHPVTAEERRDFEEFLKERNLTYEEFERLPEEVKWPLIRAWRDWRWVKYGHGS